MSFVRGSKTYHDVSFSLGTVNLELHYNITEDDKRLDTLLSQVWDYTVCKDGEYRCEMTKEYFAFHIVAHMCHHFLYGGCGIKSIVDVWLLRSKAYFDEQKLRQLCDMCGIGIFYDAVCSLSEVWFSGKPHTEQTETMQKYILAGGVYGTVGNKIIAQKNEKGGKVRYLTRRIFMPKAQLARVYPTLDKHPVLLPVCQVRRWGRVIFRGRARRAFGEIAYTAAMPKGKDKEIKEMLEKLKLKTDC